MMKKLILLICVAFLLQGCNFALSKSSSTAITNEPAGKMQPSSVQESAVQTSEIIEAYDGVFTNWIDTCKLDWDRQSATFLGICTDGKRDRNTLRIAREIGEPYSSFHVTLMQSSQEVSSYMIVTSKMFDENPVEIQCVDLDGDQNDEIIVTLHANNSRDDQEIHVLTIENGSLRECLTVFNPAISSELNEQLKPMLNSQTSVLDIYGCMGARAYMLPDKSFKLRMISEGNDYYVNDLMYDGQDWIEIEDPLIRVLTFDNKSLEDKFKQIGAELPSQYEIYNDFWGTYADLEGSGQFDDLVQFDYVKTQGGCGGYLCVKRNAQDSRSEEIAVWLPDGQGGSCYIGDFDNDGKSDALILLMSPAQGFKAYWIKPHNGEFSQMGGFTASLPSKSIVEDEDDVQRLTLQSMPISLKMIQKDNVAVLELIYLSNAVEYIRFNGIQWEIIPKT